MEWKNERNGTECVQLCDKWERSFVIQLTVCMNGIVKIYREIRSHFDCVLFNFLFTLADGSACEKWQRPKSNEIAQ